MLFVVFDAGGGLVELLVDVAGVMIVIFHPRLGGALGAMFLGVILQACFAEGLLESALSEVLNV